MILEELQVYQLAMDIGEKAWDVVNKWGYFSRGSLCELKTWIIKAHKRDLIKHSEFEALKEKIELSNKKLNKYTRTIGKNSCQ